MINSCVEGSSHVTTSPPPEKNPLKTSVRFLITNTRCKQWAKSINCSPSPGDSRRLSRPHDTVIRFFEYAKRNGYLELFYPMTFGKNERGRGPSFPPIFRSLKRALKLLIFARMSPLTIF